MMGIDRASSLLSDYGITDALVDIVRPHIQEMLSLIEQYDEHVEKTGQNQHVLSAINAYVFEQKGTIGDLRGTTVPRDGSPGSEAILGIKFLISFEYSHRYNNWTDCLYVPAWRQIVLRYNPYVVSLVMADYPQEKDKLLRDIGRFEVSIRHEVTHALRDAQTHHIKKFVERAEKDKRVMREYNEHGHRDLEFEIDAIVNSFETLRKKIGQSRYDELDEDGLERMLPGLKLPRAGEPSRRVWIQRLFREGLLPVKMMRMERGLAASAGWVRASNGDWLSADGKWRLRLFRGAKVPMWWLYLRSAGSYGASRYTPTGNFEDAVHFDSAREGMKYVDKIEKTAGTSCRTRNEDMPGNVENGPVPQHDNEWSEVRRTAMREARELLAIAKSLCGSPLDRPAGKIRRGGYWFTKDMGITTENPNEAYVFTKRELKEFFRFKVPQDYVVVWKDRSGEVNEIDGRTYMKTIY